MERFICTNVFVPLRSAPAHQSEMLSQILFGEKYHIIDKSGSWIKVVTTYDNYKGWIDSSHIQHTPDHESSTGHILNRSLECKKEDSSKIVLEAGCEIYNPDFNNKTFTLGENIYTSVSEFDESLITVNDIIADTALRFLNSPYLWGGRIPSGLDCSGFTQLVYKIHNIAIGRDSSKQAEAGQLIDFIDDTLPGDLVFFDDERGRISHSGMILSKRNVIHASGSVRIDLIDHQGIFKPEIKGYSHKLRTIRRIIK